VPDNQAIVPAKCKHGDQKECLRLAWTAEAGIRDGGDTDAKRLEKARDWHDRACAVAKQKPCANAVRVQARLDAAKALKTDADRAQFWCGDALDGAKRFTDGSKTAPVIVVAACAPLFPPKFKKSLGALQMASDADQRGELLLVLVREQLCPGLAPRPDACTPTKTVAKLSPSKRAELVGEILKAALTGDVAARAPELAGWLMR